MKITRLGTFLLGILFGWGIFYILLTFDFKRLWAPLSGVSKAERVILISVDALRPDHMSCYGYDRVTTPNLDRLAREEGILFENVYASSSWTLPSITSLLTSLHPPQHGVEDRGQRLHPSVVTLPGAFLAQGWLTSAFITHIYASSLFGLDSGFLEFRELSIDWNYREGRQMTADDVVGRVLPWLTHHTHGSYFLYIHLFDPHWDYAPPPPWDTRFTDPAYQGDADGTWDYLSRFLSADRLLTYSDLRRIVDLYDGEIAWTDSQIQLIFDHLKSLGLWEDTLLAIVADHGEEFQDHGSVHHIRTLYEEVIRVPLIVKLPGGRPGKWRARVPERVRCIDIAPTFLALAGLRVPDAFEGESLVSLMHTTGDQRDVYARTLRHKSNKAALIRGCCKLIYTFSPGEDAEELYDLEKDPLEKNPLSEENSEEFEVVRDSLRKKLDELQRKTQPSDPEEGRNLLTPEQEAHIRSLGYVE